MVSARRSGKRVVLTFGYPLSLWKPTPPGPEKQACQPSSIPASTKPRSTSEVGLPSTILSRLASPSLCARMMDWLMSGPSCAQMSGQPQPRPL